VLMSALVTKKRVRIPLAVNPRFPQPCSSAEGEPDPKVRPKGVTDGKQVNIPVLAGVCLMPRGDAEGKVGRVMDVPVQGCRRGRQANPFSHPKRRDLMTRGLCPRKAIDNPAAKKSLVANAPTIRTANRHRWVRSVSSWRVSKTMLRNSAISVRNFGRRTARSR
jgi:hypothetical protein